MSGTLRSIGVYLHRSPDGELALSPVPRGQRKRATFTRSVPTATYFDPLCPNNLPNAIPLPKARPFDPRVAPKGWTLRPTSDTVSNDPVEPVAAPPTTGLACPRCGRAGWRKSGNGLRWHVENGHPVAA